MGVDSDVCILHQIDVVVCFFFYFVIMRVFLYKIKKKILEGEDLRICRILGKRIPQSKCFSVYIFNVCTFEA